MTYDRILHGATLVLVALVVVIAAGVLVGMAVRGILDLVGRRDPLTAALIDLREIRTVDQLLDRIGGDQCTDEDLADPVTRRLSEWRRDLGLPGKDWDGGPA